MATYAGRYDEVLLRKAGNRLAPPVATTTVQVYESDGTTAATLYADRTKATTADNPVEVDSSGNLEFLADPGTYVIWRNTHGNGNVWEPGVYGWAVTPQHVTACSCRLLHVDASRGG